MSDKFSQLLPVLGAIVAFLFAALLLVYIVRLVFGRRIRAPGPRNRPRRLDIVDVFDLDKERQLVIVRRDNTEHLLLIGGPNDVLVESAISRVEGLAGRPETGRAETSRPVTPANWPAGPDEDGEPAPAPIKPTAPTGINLPPEMVTPKPPLPKPAPPPRPAVPPSAAETAPPPPAPPAAAAPPAPPRPTPGAPPPLRPAAAPSRPATPPFLARAQQIIKPRVDEGDAPSASAETKAAPPPPPRPAAPPPLRPGAPPPPPLRPAAPAVAEAPATPAEPARPAAPTPQIRPGVPLQRPAAPPPPPPAPPPAAKGQPADALESLEEEMARLLGRPEKE